MAGKLRLITLMLLIILVLTLIGASVWIFVGSITQKSQETQSSTESAATISSSSPSPSPSAMRFSPVAIGSSFTVDIPNGWTARVSTQQDFIAIQAGTPGSIDKLAYSENTPPNIDYSGIPSWNGLTEHFYVRAITKPTQAFNPQAHANVMTSMFTFNDGTVGTQYFVTKDSTEAKKWGGLLKDDKWHGRVYVYKNGNTTIEAHLAYYPSTKISIEVFEQTIKTIRP